MKNYWKKIEILLFFLAIWIILNENIRPLTVVTGIIVAVLTLETTNRLLKIDYSQEFYLPATTIFWIFCRMIRAIYLAGFDLFKRILTGDLKPTFYAYETKIKSPLLLVLLSNRMTMPPGSATVWREGSKFLFIFVHDDEEAMLAELHEVEERLIKLEGEE